MPHWNTAIKRTTTSDMPNIIPNSIFRKPRRSQVTLTMIKRQLEEECSHLQSVLIAPETQMWGRGSSRSLTPRTPTPSQCGGLPRSPPRHSSARDLFLLNFKLFFLKTKSCILCNDPNGIPSLECGIISETCLYSHPAIVDLKLPSYQPTASSNIQHRSRLQDVEIQPVETSLCRSQGSRHGPLADAAWGQRFEDPCQIGAGLGAGGLRAWEYRR